MLRLKRKAAGDLALALFFYVGIAMGAVFASRAGEARARDAVVPVRGPVRRHVGWASRRSARSAMAVVAAMRLAGPRTVRRRDRRGLVARRRPCRSAPLSVALAALTAGVIVAGMRIVGVLLIAAMMVLPVASAQLIARSFRGTMRLAVAIGAVSSLVGLTTRAAARPRARRLDRVRRGGAVRGRRPREADGAASPPAGGPLMELHQEAATRSGDVGPAIHAHPPTARGHPRESRDAARASRRSSEGGRTCRRAPRTGTSRSSNRRALIRRVASEDGFARYELAEELTGHHHHLMCSRCGRVQDLHIPTPLERQLDRTLDVLAREARFASVSHRLDLIGLCRDCATRLTGSSDLVLYPVGLSQPGALRPTGGS